MNPKQRTRYLLSGAGALLIATSAVGGYAWQKNGRAEPLGEVELRGFPGTIDVVRLQGAPTEVRHDTGELWTRNPLV